MPERAHDDHGHAGDDRMAATVALRIGQREADAVKALGERSGVGSSAVLRQAVRQLVENPQVVITQQPAGSAGDPWANAQWRWTTTLQPAAWTGEQPV